MDNPLLSLPVHHIKEISAAWHGQSVVHHYAATYRAAYMGLFNVTGCSAALRCTRQGTNTAFRQRFDMMSRGETILAELQCKQQIALCSSIHTLPGLQDPQGVYTCWKFLHLIQNKAPVAQCQQQQTWAMAGATFTTDASRFSGAVAHAGCLVASLGKPTSQLLHAVCATDIWLGNVCRCGSGATTGVQHLITVAMITTAEVQQMAKTSRNRHVSTVGIGCPPCQVQTCIFHYDLLNSLRCCCSVDIAQTYKPIAIVISGPETALLSLQKNGRTSSALHIAEEALMSFGSGQPLLADDQQPEWRLHTTSCTVINHPTTSSGWAPQVTGHEVEVV